ncbi:MAG: hypothetical protein Q9M23_03960, partial [Mariprofundaceae bacterium]|nr:hypothetical protein [Mariprofundaceae bacterium]
VTFAPGFLCFRQGRRGIEGSKDIPETYPLFKLSADRTQTERAKKQKGHRGSLSILSYFSMG